MDYQEHTTPSSFLNKERVAELLHAIPPPSGLKLVKVVQTVEETKTTTTKKRNKKHVKNNQQSKGKLS